jgi:ankyrin repeat protein
MVSEQNGQEWLMDKMEYLGYSKIDKYGQCYGIAAMARQAFLANDLETFNKRIDILEALTESDMALLKSTPLGNTVKVAGHDISPMELYAFFDGVQLYQQPGSYRGIISAAINNQLESNASLVSSEGISPVAMGNFTGNYTVKELGKFYTLLQKCLTEPTSFTITSGNHAINLNFDPKFEQWILIDANQLLAKKFTTQEVDKLASQVSSAMNLGKPSTGNIVLNTKLYSRQPDALKDDLIFMKDTLEWENHRSHTLSNLMVKDSQNENLLGMVVARNDDEIFSQLIKNDPSILTNTEVAFVAVWNGSCAIIRSLLDAGLDANATFKGQTLLAEAVARGDSRMLALLIEKGDANIANDKKDTPLTVAVKQNAANALDMVEILAKHGALLDKVDGMQNTPLIHAIRNHNYPLVKMLVEKGADINKPDADGFTPLMHSVVQRTPNITEFLIGNNADLDKENVLGEKALDISCNKGNWAAEELLGKSNDIINKYKLINCLKARFPQIYQEEPHPDKDYFQQIGRLIREIEQMDTSGKTVIDNICEKWFEKLNVSQQNRFQAEMPSIISDTKSAFVTALIRERDESLRSPAEKQKFNNIIKKGSSAKSVG